MNISRNRLAELAATPKSREGRYRNLESVSGRGPTDFLRWILDPRRRFPPGKRYPLQQPDSRTLNQPPPSPQLTWLGHASFLFQHRGLNILTDPVLSERVSPFPFMGPKRHTPAPLAVKDLPEIHKVLVSHNHYDHLDETTIRQLRRRFGNNLCFCIPMGLRPWFEKRGIRNLIELEWGQSNRFNSGGEIFCLPAQHFSGRTVLDTNETLWCSWLLEVDGFRLYFAGDTGYGKIFRKIGEIFAPVDLALLPIGAYEPRWYMGPVHLEPEESVQVHRDIGARQSVAMHWGTFVLTDEPMNEPPERLEKALQAEGMDANTFRVMDHGETLIL